MEACRVSLADHDVSFTSKVVREADPTKLW